MDSKSKRFFLVLLFALFGATFANSEMVEGVPAAAYATYERDVHFCPWLTGICTIPPLAQVFDD